MINSIDDLHSIEKGLDVSGNIIKQFDITRQMSSSFVMGIFNIDPLIEKIYKSNIPSSCPQLEFFVGKKPFKNLLEFQSVLNDQKKSDKTKMKMIKRLLEFGNQIVYRTVRENMAIMTFSSRNNGHFDDSVDEYQADMIE